MTRPRPEQARVLVLDTENLAVGFELDRGDGVFVLLADQGNWIELPVTCPAEFVAAQRLVTSLFEALLAAAPHHPARPRRGSPADGVTAGPRGGPTGPPPRTGPLPVTAGNGVAGVPDPLSPTGGIATGWPAAGAAAAPAPGPRPAPPGGPADR